MSSWRAASWGSDPLHPRRGPSQAQAEPITRVRTTALQRCSVRRETTDSPVPAKVVHSWAGAIPSRSTRATVSSTESSVDRPRHSTAGINEGAEPSQNRTRRIGTRSNTSPVDRSCTRVR